MNAEPLGLFEEPNRRCTRCLKIRPISSFHRKGEEGRRKICGDCRNEVEPSRLARTPEDRLRCLLMNKYGITMGQYQTLLDAQGGVCAICGVAPTPERRLHVDHCHQSGRVRALLCQPCNTQLGSYEKMRDLAAAYLAKYGAGNPLLDYDAEPVSRDAVA